MTSHLPESVSLGDVDDLDDVVDRQALSEVCRSIFDLFGLSIRIVSRSGSLLADVHQERAVCRYLNTLARGRLACAQTVSSVKDTEATTDTLVHPCFTGAVYRIGAIRYQGRPIGRVILGPYLPAEITHVPESLLQVDPSVEPTQAQGHLAEMPRVREETAEKIIRHVVQTVDQILFASHRTQLTTQMHVAHVRENYRELAEKTANLQQAYERLRELDRLKSNFLAMVSHELRTPLTSIIGYSEMLSAGVAGELQNEQLEFVGTIQDKGEHLLALITSLLDLNKLEQGTVRLHVEALDVDELLQDVLSTVKPRADHQGIRLWVECHSENLRLHADRLRLLQILGNLLDNAIKFTPRDGEVRLTARSVQSSFAREGESGFAILGAQQPAVEFSVRDTGLGIPADQRDRIFDAFYQIDSSPTRQHGGAGLGLSIVKRLVDAHHGTIDVKSTPGKGTEFCVTIADSSHHSPSSPP